MVGFSSPFYILKPVDMARGNRKIFYGVNNRGNKLEYAWRTHPAAWRRTTTTRSRRPISATRFLLRLGYTYVDAGWQGNVAPGDDRLVPNLPVADRSRRPADRRADPRRVRRCRGLHPPARRQSCIHVARVPYETADIDTRACDADGSQHGRRRQDADSVGPLGVRPLREGPGEPRADHDGHLSVRRLQGRSHLRADLSGEESDGPGARLRRHPRPRVVPALPDARRCGQSEPARAERRPTSASAGPTAPASRRPGCTCETGSTWASTKTNRIARCSTRCRSPFRERIGCSPTSSSAIRTTTRVRTSGTIRCPTRTRR